MSRLSWTTYFKNILSTVALRSSCPRRKVGCLIVKDNRIAATGYNGMPSGFPDCEEYGKFCGRRKSGTALHTLPCIHAEINALLQCARFGVSVESAECWVSVFPCNDCLKALIGAGISKLYYCDYYTLTESEEKTRLFLVEESGIQIEKI